MSEYGRGLTYGELFEKNVSDWLFSYLARNERAWDEVLIWYVSDQSDEFMWCLCACGCTEEICPRRWYLVRNERIQCTQCRETCHSERGGR